MSIVPLDSPRWRELQQAYGSAAGIPALLKALPRAAPSDGNSEPWRSLWSSLCHQGTVYTASYASVPHIAAAAARRDPKDRLDHLVLIASIAVGRRRPDAAAMPSDLLEDFEVAVQQAAGLAADCLRVAWNGTEYRNLLGALSILQGQETLGELLLAFDDTYECPNCEKSLTETLI